MDGYIIDFGKFKHWAFDNKKRLNIFLALAFAIIAIFAAAQSFAQTTPPNNNPPATGNPPVVEQSFVDSLFAETQNFEQRRSNAFQRLNRLDCFTCEIFAGFSNSVFGVGAKVDEAGASLIPAMVNFTILFVFFYLGSAFVAGDASDLLGRWQVVWRLILATIGGTVFLAQPFTYSWDIIFSTIFSIGTGVVNMMGGLPPISSTCTGVTPPISGIPEGARSVLSEMSLTVCGAYKMTLNGLATGIALSTQTDGLFNTIINTIAGFIVIFIYGFIAFIFPLRFIDVVLRVGIVGILTPIIGVLAVFKPTRSYVSIAISNVLNATMQFAIMSIMFIIGQTVLSDFLSTSGLSTGEQDISFLSNLLNAFVLVGVAFVFQGMLASVPAIAAEFSKYGGSGNAAGSAATNFASKVVTAPATAAGVVAGVAATGTVAGLVAAKTAANKLNKGTAE